MATSTHIVISHQDIALLATYLANEGGTGDEVAEAVRKPWNYTVEIAQAKVAIAAWRTVR
jgi:hypothetical protein